MQCDIENSTAFLYYKSSSHG